MGEFESIRKIKEQFASLVGPQMEGIGDDCATIIGAESSQLFTTDILVEGVHFLRDKISARELGRKSLSVSLSDIAAMGGIAQSSFLSVALPASLDNEWYPSFLEGYREVSAEYAVPLLGGDTSRSLRDIVINVLVTGVVNESHRKCRKVAMPGDLIFVGSTLGDAACGLKLHLSPDAIYNATDAERLLQAQNNPRPQMNLGKFLGTHKNVHAMMDISDGIGSDLRHILDASKVGAKIWLDKLPLSDELISTCSINNWDPLSFAIEGGEDYCLMFSCSRDISNEVLSQIGETVYCIGEITDNIGNIEWMDNGKLQNKDYKGFTHF